VAYVPEKGWFWYIPQHRDMISVGVVAEGKYLTRDGVRAPEAIFKREIEQNAWIKAHLACGTPVGPYRLTSEYSWRSRYCAVDGLLLAGDAFGFLDPVFSSGVMLALKSGCLAADTIAEAFRLQDFSAERFADYSRTMREGLENMRKLVYAFYEQQFSFRKLTNKYPELAGDITDCLSGDVNKDFSRLYAAVGFMETAEHGFFRSLGFSVAGAPGGLEVCLPRVHAECDYAAPLRFEDEVLVRLLVERKGPRSLTYQFRFCRVNGTMFQEVARGRLTVASVERQPDGSMKAVPLPRFIADKIRQAPAHLLEESILPRTDASAAGNGSAHRHPKRLVRTSARSRRRSTKR
ncbi:MAG: tryptophan 7-halogenase, partial [Verrucomicrobia bacterium]|nr:tryptophan 7-halogenase [Verrucomicrobiota bacterium]